MSIKLISMLEQAFLPKMIKEILTHIPTIAFKIVDWKSFMHEAGPILSRISHRRPSENLLDFFNTSSSPVSSGAPPQTHHQRSLSFSDGEKILTLYFLQLLNPNGIFLDLRQHHFVKNDVRLHFCPNNLWVKFETDFKKALIDLYCGFYWSNDHQFEKALVDLGLTNNLQKEKKDELVGLFRRHFGMGDQEQVEFSLQKFQQSFYDLFHFFLNNNIRLKSEFLFLGVYLATLYLNLEQIGGKYNVRKIFLDLFPK